MKNEFVPYDIALAMKELGFDEPCFGFYSLHDDNKAVGGNYPCDGTNNAPLYQQAFRWFRDNCGFDIIISNRGYTVSLKSEIDGEPDIRYSSTLRENRLFENYEQTQDSCLRKLIEMVKNKE
jgi:hypothetical protein